MASMADKYKCAVLGTGGRGGGWVSKMNAHEKCDVVAVNDINKTRLKKFKEEYNVNTYTDYHELLDNEDLDFCIIASPHYLHAPMTVAAANHDVHVFCEKPMAINLQQCDEMIIATRVNDVKLAIGFQHHYSPTLEYLKLAVEGAEGELGSLGRITDVIMTGRHYRSEMYYLGSTQVDPGTGVPAGQWRGRWKTEGAGILINQAVHNIDAFQYVCGPIRSVQAYAKTISKEHKFIEVEDTVVATCELENGGFGNMIMTSSNKKSDKNSITIHGTNGYIRAEGGFCANFVTADTRYESEEDYEIPFHMDPNWNQVDNFLIAIEKDKEPFVNGEEARKSIELIRAILKSEQTAQRVQLPLADSVSSPTINNVNRRQTPEY